MDNAFFADEARRVYALIGPVGAVLVALSVVSIWLILLKTLTFMRARLGSTAAANEYLRRMGEHDAEAIHSLEASSAPIARILLIGAQLLRDNAPLSRVEADMRDAATSYLLRLSRYNRTLELIGLIAPLLGLLGTILGMIKAFQALELSGAQADPAVLAGGIWEALLTTALGLAVAIPAIVAFNLFENRVDGFRQQASTIFARFLAAVEATRGRL